MKRYFIGLLAALCLVAMPATAQAPNTPGGCGGTITAGGTAQNAHAANPSGPRILLANISSTEVMWFSYTGTAVAEGPGSFPLAPLTATTYAGLSSFTSPDWFRPVTALSVVAATTGHKWSCNYLP